MKANELMIGDLVNFLIDVEGGDTENDPKNVVYQPMQVDSISSLDEVSSAFYGVTNDAAQLRPIPLTAEILENNGFRKKNYIEVVGGLDTYYLEEEIGSFRIHRLQNGYYQFGLAKIKYVHQLQHALRLCNIEKEIEL